MNIHFWNQCTHSIVSNVIQSWRVSFEIIASSVFEHRHPLLKLLHTVRCFQCSPFKYRLKSMQAQCSVIQISPFEITAHTVFNEKFLHLEPLHTECSIRNICFRHQCTAECSTITNLLLEPLKHIVFHYKYLHLESLHTQCSITNIWIRNHCIHSVQLQTSASGITAHMCSVTNICIWNHYTHSVQLQTSTSGITAHTCSVTNICIWNHCTHSVRLQTSTSEITAHTVFSNKHSHLESLYTQCSVTNIHIWNHCTHSVQ